MGVKIKSVAPPPETIQAPAAAPATPVPAPAAVPEKPVTVAEKAKKEAPKPAATPSEVEARIAHIRKTLGDKSIVKGSEILTPRRQPTGIFEFDLATGGGFPYCRYSVVYGPESSGKSNVLYKAIAQVQRLPPPCNKAVLVDLEGTFDPMWAARLGVDVDALIVCKPSYGEQAVDMIDALIRASDVALIGLDSIAVVVAAKEVDGSTEKADVGTSALLVKRLANKLAIALSEEQKRGHEVCVVLLNQTRFKIGVLFGDPETMPGGQTLKFNSSLTVRLYGKNKTVKEISSQIPAFKETNMVIKKAKVGITKASTEFDMALIEHDNLCVGDTDSWNAVKGYLQAGGHLVNTGKGWQLLGVTYPKLEVIRDTYYAENDFSVKLQQMVIKQHEMVLVAEGPEAQQQQQASA